MKYDEQVFSLSMKAYNMVKLPENNIDEEVKKKQDKLLKLLLAKCLEQLSSKKNTGDGILKFKFERRFFSDFNDGYREIDELVKSNNFDSFASDYCMYIGDIEQRCDEYNTAYYEIIWDYKTYFEQLKESKEGKETIRAIRKQEKDAIINAKREFCKKNGHSYGEWQEKRWTTLEEDGPSGIEALFTGTGIVEVEHVKWIRTCSICGAHQSRSTKPAEAEKKELEEQIKKLQRKLDMIKE